MDWNGGDENACELKQSVKHGWEMKKQSDKLSSDLLNLKLMRLKQLCLDENRDMFHHSPQLIFVIYHSRHKTAICHLKKAASRVGVIMNSKKIKVMKMLNNGSDKMDVNWKIVSEMMTDDVDSFYSLLIELNQTTLKNQYRTSNKQYRDFKGSLNGSSAIYHLNPC